MNVEQCVLPIMISGQVMNFHAQVIIRQTFPAAMLVLLYEYLYRLAEKLLPEEAAMFLVQIEQTLATSFLHLVFDLYSHAGRSCALARGEAEDVCFGEGESAGELIGLLKVLLGFAWKASNNVGSDRHAWDEALCCCDDRAIAFAIVAARHFAQDRI